jgi:hypothetical protein
MRRFYRNQPPGPATLTASLLVQYTERAGWFNQPSPRRQPMTITQLNTLHNASKLNAVEVGGPRLGDDANHHVVEELLTDAMVDLRALGGEAGC